jgi:hypothetical protein
MSSITQPLDIAPSSYLSRDSSYQSSCAYPSWPQRSCLSDSPQEQRASSYLSDDDLFFCDALEDDAHSIASSNSNASSPTAEQPFVTEQQLLEMRREQMELQREAVKAVLREKEQRRQAFRRSRSRSQNSKKSPKGKAMAPITENGE